MEHIRARVLDGDKVLHEDVEIALNLIEPSRGAKQYTGCFQIQSEPTGFDGEGPFQLHFEDGRLGSFASPRIQQLPASFKISFTLDGAPRKRKP